MDQPVTSMLCACWFERLDIALNLVFSLETQGSLTMTHIVNFNPHYMTCYILFILVCVKTWNLKTTYPALTEYSPESSHCSVCSQKTL